LADELGVPLSAVVVGNSSQEIAGVLASYGADVVYQLQNPLLEENNTELHLEVLSEFIKEGNPRIVLGGATLFGRNLSTRLAARLKAGLISECISLSLDQGGSLLGTKLTHGGKITSTIVVSPNSRPQMATVKPGFVTAARPNPNRNAEVISIASDISQKESRIHVRGTIKADPKKISLDEADIIVAGGKGLGNSENFQLLEEMAKYLGGVVAGSLGAIDEGWLPRKKLVGQTGTSVAPKLYVACGISGSIYHVLGMRSSEFVIAINNDPNAPIFKVADMGIIGDVVDVVSAIIDQLRLGENSTKNG
jgi:electron transfer flavoprotein alpha subunit